MSNEWGKSERYNWHTTGIECIDVIEPFTYNLANAMKYIWRAGAPADAYDGDRAEDLRKAIRYLIREGERKAHESMLPSFRKSLDQADDGIDASIAEWERTSGPIRVESCDAIHFHESHQWGYGAGLRRCVGRAAIQPAS